MPKRKKFAPTVWLSATLVEQAATDGAYIAEIFTSHAKALLDVFKIAMKAFKKVTTDPVKLKNMRADYTMAMKANKAFEVLYDGDNSARVQVSKAWKIAEGRKDEDAPKAKYNAARSVNSIFNKLTWPEWAAFLAAVKAKDSETK